MDGFVEPIDPPSELKSECVVDEESDEAVDRGRRRGL